MEDAPFLLTVTRQMMGEQAGRRLVHDHVGPFEALDPVHGVEPDPGASLGRLGQAIGQPCGEGVDVVVE